MPTSPRSFKAELRAVLTLGLPLAGSHLAQFMLAVTDTIMLGWFDVVHLAASVIGAAVFFTMFTFGLGFANAVMPLVATASASGDDTEVRRATRMGLWLSAGFALAVYPLFWFSGTILSALGQPPEVVPLAQDYLRLMGVALLPALIVAVLKNYLAALGRTQVALWLTVMAVFLNIALNWVLIFGQLGLPEMGVRGAAHASIWVQVATALGLAVYCGRAGGLRRYTLFQRFWRPDWQAMGQVWRLGWPIGVALVAETALFSAVAILVGRLGTLELAAHGIAVEISAAMFMVHMGLSNAGTVLVGRARGKSDTGMLRANALATIFVSVCFAQATMVVYILFGGELIGLFLSPDEAARDQIIALGAVLMVVAALFQLADGAQVVAMGLLRGVQDTKVPMWIAAFSYWGIGFPAGYLFGLGLNWGAPGVWIGLVLGLGTASLLLMWRFWSGRALTR